MNVKLIWSVVRFLPNLTQEGKIGQSAIEKITHYVDIKNQKELSGWFDSPKNFNEKCPLTDLYYTMQNSKNAVLIEKSKQLNYSMVKLIIPDFCKSVFNFKIQSFLFCNWQTK